MPRLRSLIVRQAHETSDVVVDAVNDSLVDWLSPLLHLAVWGQALMRRLSRLRLPQLVSLSLHDLLHVDLTALSMRTFCVFLS